MPPYTEDSPLHTRQSLARDFAALGMAPGQIVLVHSSLKKLGGWILGGAQTVTEALLDVLGPEGTLMMPTHSSDNTNPANWQNPPVPESWWPIIREQAPPYDPAKTITRMMGQLPEQFRRYPGVLRSDHPVGSFAAIGKHAAYLTADHRIEDDMFGEQSPIGKLYQLDGYVLMLGVDHGNNTSLHLAEYRGTWGNGVKQYVDEGCAMMVDGERRWVPFKLLDLEDEDFAQIGAEYEASIGYTPGKVGEGEAHFVRQAPLVDFGVQWMGKHRG